MACFYNTRLSQKPAGICDKGMVDSRCPGAIFRLEHFPVSQQNPAPGSEIILYQTEDGRTLLEVKLENETVWLTQKQLAELFQKDVRTINEHIQNILEEGELNENSVIRNFRITAADGKSYDTKHFNLEVIIAVGYRVKSHRGTQFRQWATARLSEYIVKGFTMDDERLKNPPGKGHTDYFDGLLERIRDIRSSERRFYQKVLDIYATSVDYAPDAEMTQAFFATVQNKMHWATHGHTAAEVIHKRADAKQPFMGLKTTRPGGIIRKEDVTVAKNYLTEEELQTLNRIVTLYLEFAELKAMQRQPMTMRDWISKLDEFLKISGQKLLDHAGKISAEVAKSKAEQEYRQYHAFLDTQPRKVDLDFEKAVKQLPKAAPSSKPVKKPKPPTG
jgi:hypothetical protein